MCENNNHLFGGGMVVNYLITFVIQTFTYCFRSFQKRPPLLLGYIMLRLPSFLVLHMHWNSTCITMLLTIGI